MKMAGAYDTSDDRFRSEGGADPLDDFEECGPHLLDDVLTALRVDSSNLFAFDFHGPWAIDIRDTPIPISWTLLEGTVWVFPPSGREPQQFRPGDTFLFPRGTGRSAYVLASSSDVAPVPARDLWQQARLRPFQPGSSGARPHYGSWGTDGTLTRVVSTAFTFNDRQIGPLVAALPELMVVRAGGSEASFIDTLLNFTLRGEDTDKPGFAVLATQTAQMLLVRMVRRYALSLGDDAFGWLAGLGDARIGRALACIHREPKHGWTVAELARVAGLSRSLFAERFLNRVGETPMQYLRAWRIHLAREALTSGEATVAVLAHDLGYQSEAAFRRAFRGLTGQSPSGFRRGTGGRPGRADASK